ncbi:MAG TPA: metallophosphoesterase [Chitinophagales bacterium]|nr:metallophosphoesterase [Chitinophagales bacterium]
MIFIVGDIHGEITKLKLLVKNVLTLDTYPQFVFIGDYIDKGENSKETLDYLTWLNQEYACTFLTGNHEYLWQTLQPNDMAGMEYLLKYGGKATMKSFDASFGETQKRMLDEYAGFFSSLKYYWTKDKYVAVHSGIKPADYQIPLEAINPQDFLFNRYDFLKQDQYYFENRTVIFGHTAFFSPYCDGYKIGIDTGACFIKEQPLTSFCVDLNLFLDSDNVQHPYSIERNMCSNIIRQKPWRSNYD